MSLDELYREVIMDHYRHPRHRGTLEQPSVSVTLHNPLCGDEVQLQLVVREGKIEAASWTGQGCSISQSSASMMTDAVIGLSVADALKLVANFQGLMHGEAPPYAEPALGDLEALGGVAKFPVRIKCALLPWEALSKALNQQGD